MPDTDPGNRFEAGVFTAKQTPHRYFSIKMLLAHWIDEHCLTGFLRGWSWRQLEN
jgi:nucleoside 2-deoxyribosyltransferase